MLLIEKHIRGSTPGGLKKRRGITAIAEMFASTCQAVTAIHGTLGFGLAFNGLIMFAIPAAWYASFPGVAVADPIWMVSPLLADKGNKGEEPC
jgi:hypothetical protein